MLQNDYETETIQTEKAGKLEWEGEGEKGVKIVISIVVVKV